MILVKQFITACPPDVVAYLKQSKIERPEAIAEDADRYLAAHGKKLQQKRSTGKSTDVQRYLICNGLHLARDCSQNKTGKYCVKCKFMTHL